MEEPHIESNFSFDSAAGVVDMVVAGSFEHLAALLALHTFFLRKIKSCHAIIIEVKDISKKSKLTVS